MISQEVQVILSCPAFLGNQVRPLFPFFLFFHLVREGPGDQVNREGLVDLEVQHDLLEWKHEKIGRRYAKYIYIIVFFKACSVGIFMLFQAKTLV